MSILIKNGKIIDGTGNPWYKADIGLKDGKIVDIGKLEEKKFMKSYNAEDLIVCPGFIDIHTHSDMVLTYCPTADSHVMQGITLDVVGNCGTIAALLSEKIRKRMAEPMNFYKQQFDWTNTSEYLASLEKKGVSINVAALIGQGSVREAIMGLEKRPPTEKELVKMKELVRKGMEAGAFGLSTGLFYTPSGYASTYEIIQLARVVAEYGGIYASHIRGECDRLIPAIKELIEIAESAEIPAQIAHYKAMGESNWGLAANQGWKLIKKARARGVDVTLDAYAWTAGVTSLFSFFPYWAQEGGPKKLVERLTNSNTRERIKVEMNIGTPERETQPGDVGWDNEIISRSKIHPEYEGKSFSEVAREQGKAPVDFALDLFIDDQEIGTIDYWGCEEDLKAVMNLPVFMLSSDSSAIQASEYMKKRGLAHPRTFGNVPEYLGTYVREKAFLTLEEAIRKGTSLPAQRLGLQDRGILKKGMWGDILVFDPVKIRAVSTYEDPYHYPEGIKWVFVNGILTVDNGIHTGKRAGKVLRHKKVLK
jgi:N-acyl-D-amino-acid deacylase